MLLPVAIVHGGFETDYVGGWPGVAVCPGWGFGVAFGAGGPLGVAFGPGVGPGVAFGV